jgi:hypothetical protein
MFACTNLANRRSSVQGTSDIDSGETDPRGQGINRFCDPGAGPTRQSEGLSVD